MGLHNLCRTRIPVLLIAGRAPMSTFDAATGGRDTYVHFIQEPFDQASVVRPYVKWEYNLAWPSMAHEVVSRAGAVMQSDPTGPVYLTLPREVLAAPVDAASMGAYGHQNHLRVKAQGADAHAVRAIAEQLIFLFVEPINPLQFPGEGACGICSKITIHIYKLQAALKHSSRVWGAELVHFVSLYSQHSIIHHTRNEPLDDRHTRCLHLPVIIRDWHMQLKTRLVFDEISCNEMMIKGSCNTWISQNSYHLFNVIDVSNACRATAKKAHPSIIARNVNVIGIICCDDKIDFVLHLNCFLMFPLPWNSFRYNLVFKEIFSFLVG
jgi:hypothetical protein